MERGGGAAYQIIEQTHYVQQWRLKAALIVSGLCVDQLSNAKLYPNAIFTEPHCQILSHLHREIR